MNSIFKYPKAENLGVPIVWKNSWLALLPKTLISHQLETNTTKLFPDLLNYSPSNHGP